MATYTKSISGNATFRSQGEWLKGVSRGTFGHPSYNLITNNRVGNKVLVLSPQTHVADTRISASHCPQSFTVAGYTGFYKPPLKEVFGEANWVWFSPVILATPTPSTVQDWLFDRIRNAGFAVCGLDVGELYGNTANIEIYNLFYNYLVGTYRLNLKATLFPQSRGGLMLYNWAASNPTKVRKSGGIYPVSEPRSYPEYAAAVTAYGSDASVLTHTPNFILEPLALQKVPIYHVHGDSDVVVPIADNSTLLKTVYEAWGGTMTVEIVAGHGHEEVDEYFQDQTLLDFIIG